MSCRETDRDKDDETVATFDNALAEHLFNDAWKQVHRWAMRDSILNDTGITQIKDICVQAIRSKDTAFFPIDLILNYGFVNQSCLDGRERRGRIRATFDSRYTSPTSTVVITFQDYFVDNVEVPGTITLIHQGFNNAGNRVSRMIVENGMLEGRDVLVEWEASRKREWIAGDNTHQVIDDDVFLMTGVSQGRHTRGNTFVTDCIGPMRYSLGCLWITSGVLTLDVPNLAPRWINYGDGTCENNVTVSRDNTAFQVLMP